MNYSSTVQNIQTRKQLFLLLFGHLVIPLTELHLKLNASPILTVAFFVCYSHINHDIEAAELRVWRAFQSRGYLHVSIFK